MSLPTHILIAAAEALNAADAANTNLEVVTKGAGYVIRDTTKLPGAQNLGEYDAYDAVEVEMSALKDARRIIAVANVIAKYERKRVWAEAIVAVESTHVPTAESAPVGFEAALDDMSRIECVIEGAKQNKTTAVNTVFSAMKRDKKAHGDNVE